MSSLPVSAPPLTAEQTTTLHSVVDQLSPAQKQWVSGYVAGLAAVNDISAAVTPATAPIASPESQLTVLFGSQTGNGEQIARQLAASVEAAGYSARLASLADYKPANLKREKYVAFVVSTHGEGDPPDDAELFREFLLSDRAPKLPDLKYSVLALGDSSYVNFCQAGREFDVRLEELGATRISPIAECDLDYDEAAAEWSGKILTALPELLEKSAVSQQPILRAVESTSAYDKNNPFEAEVLANQKITGGNSTKDVRHIELSIEGSGLVYEPGDSLAVVAENPPQLLAELGAEIKDPDTNILVDREITALSVGFLREWAVLAESAELSAILDDKEALGEFLDNHQLIDVIREYRAEVSAEQLAALLRPLSPRSYSIASSLAANPDEVHLTVAPVQYEAFGSEHWGAASTYLADRVEVGDTVKVFVERNSRFRLPAPDVPVIMIGPGTGVAPFRAFVEERVEQGATGDNWLFFGDRNFDSDFLYQIEWLRHLKAGNLTNLDVAFSRDQRKKIYVQDRIREKASEVYEWLERGASIYVCGDAKHMAGDVHEALIDVIAEQARIDRDVAEQRLKETRQAGRYQRDVY